MHALRCVCAVTLLLGLGSTSGLAQKPASTEADLVIGAWQLDLAKSNYAPGPAPRSEVRTYDYDHEGIRATILTTDAQGVERMVEYVASYNDVVAIVSGSNQVDAVKMRKVNETTAETTLVFQGKVVGTARRVIAADGKSMTITFRRDAPDKVNNVAFYRKVASDR